MTEQPPAATEEEDRRTRPFADLLRELDKGRVHTELSDQLQKVVQAVMAVRKPGGIQLTIKIDAGKGDDMVEVTCSVTAKPPRAARTSVFFVDDEHNLSRNNPAQPYLPLSGLPGDGPAEQSRSAR